MRGRGLRTTLQVFSACNYYAGIATTSNTVFQDSMKSALQELVRSYLRQAQRYTVYSSNFHHKLFKVVCICKADHTQGELSILKQLVECTCSIRYFMRSTHKQ